MPELFKQKSDVLIDAVQFISGQKTLVFEFVTSARAFILSIESITELKIEMPNGGVLVAREYDWLIKEADGSFRVCSPTLFKENYELIF